MATKSTEESKPAARKQDPAPEVEQPATAAPAQAPTYANLHPVFVALVLGGLAGIAFALVMIYSLLQAKAMPPTAEQNATALIAKMPTPVAGVSKEDVQTVVREELVKFDDLARARAVEHYVSQYKNMTFAIDQAQIAILQAIQANCQPAAPPSPTLATTVPTIPITSTGALTVTNQPGRTLQPGDVWIVPKGWTCSGDIQVWEKDAWTNLFDTGEGAQWTGLVVDFKADTKIRAPWGCYCDPDDGVDVMKVRLEAAGCENGKGCLKVSVVTWPK